jgi:mannose-6-phosphate isomerase-like protein (cupin superfamily)
MKPYVLADGEGRKYEWHDVLFTIKAAGAETGGAFALWDVTTRPGEEPHMHVHEVEDEIFYLISGSMTFRCGDELFGVEDHGFVFVPRGTPHTYTIQSDEARLLGLSTPSTFGDNLERPGRPRG